MKTAKDITTLAVEIQRQQEAKEDFVTPSPALTLLTDKETGVSEINFKDEEGVLREFRMLPLAHEQIGIGLQIPKSYYERLRTGVPAKNSRAMRPANTALLDHTVNTLWRTEPRARMIRTLDGNARAYLSNRYRMLDNYALAEAILPVISEMETPQIEGELTDLKLYLKVLLPKIQATVPEVGDIVQAGFIVKNSEVGHGALSVQMLVYTLACKNGMVVPAYDQRRYHVGRAWEAGEEEAYKIFSDATLKLDDQAFFAKVADVIKAAANEAKFQDIVARLGEAATTKPMEDVQEGVTRLAKKHTLTEGEASGILTHLAAGGNLTLYGLHAAVTRTAQDVESYDRSVELEELGGKLIEMPKKEWHEIAVA